MEQCILPVYMCIFFHRDQMSLRGSIGQICQNSPIHGICHWLSRARAVTGWETKLSWARAVTGWETTLGRAWPVTGWETTRPLLLKGIRYPIIVKGVTVPYYDQPGSNWILWPINLMLTDFTPNWGLFLFIVISHDRRLEHGWNWILWPSNLMLTDFMPNWALFLFSPFPY